jgi:ABC-2 type transport system permease protein
VVFRRAATAALAAIALWIVMSLFLDTIVSVVANLLRPIGQDSTFAEQVNNATLQLNLARFAPSRLYEEITAAVLDPTVRTVGFVLPDQADRAIPSILPVGQSLLIIWPQVVGLLALMVICFAAAYIDFMRQAVRA